MKDLLEMPVERKEEEVEKKRRGGVGWGREKSALPAQLNGVAGAMLQARD